MVRFWMVVALALVWPAVAMAEKRMALVIGNDAYAEVPVLAKAVADARAVAATLEEVGFETTLATDLGRREFNIKVAQFTAQLQRGDTALIYFAGHGVEIDGENYLLPVDILGGAGVSSDLVTAESISLSTLLDRVRRTGAKATLAILDACRDNPFPKENGRSLGRGRGLGRIAAPEGTFVLFSAGAGQQALDRLDAEDQAENSVFTRNLLPRLTEPGLELRELISGLRVDVRDLAKTRSHEQFPAYYDELLGEFYFVSAPVNGAATRSPNRPLVLPPDLPALADMGTVLSRQSVPEVVAALEAAAAEAGVRVLGRIDQREQAARGGVALPEAQLLLLSREAETAAALQDNILAGMHLPLRVFVFSHNELTVIAYEHPEEVFDDLAISGAGDYLARMDVILRGVTQAAAGE